MTGCKCLGEPICEDIYSLFFIQNMNALYVPITGAEMIPLVDYKILWNDIAQTFVFIVLVYSVS